MKCDELKAFRIIQGDTGGYGAPSYKCDADGNQIEEWSDACEVYDKSEADRYIQELEMDRDSYKVTYEDYRRRVKTQGQLLSIELKNSKHHKYKRCLAMAKWCRIHDEITQLESERLGLSQRALFIEYRRKAMWWNKWHRRWLEFAEKFKPNNSTDQ